MIAIVLAVDRGFAHARSVRSLSSVQRRDAMIAAKLGYLRLLPRRDRWPRRYVVTAQGSHALGTFRMASDDLRAEVERDRAWRARQEESKRFKAEGRNECCGAIGTFRDVMRGGWEACVGCGMI